MSDLLPVLMGITLLYLAVAGMVGAYIRVLVLQGILLFGFALNNISGLNITAFLFAAVETLLFKAILIPWFLNKTVKENGIKREIEPDISTFYSLFAVSVIFILGFTLAFGSTHFTSGVNPVAFGVSFSMIMTGLLLIVTRKKLITHIMGYMVMENGIFLLSLSLAREMPVIVALGISLDIFIGVLLAGVFISRIKSTFDDQDVDNLSTLRD